MSKLIRTVTVLAACGCFSLLASAGVVITSEMSQMDGAIQAFMTQYQIDYVPSQLILERKYNANPAAGLETESQDYILKTIGRNSPTFKTYWAGTGINWIQTSAGGS